jgi:DNA-binding transcriptional ArsR family regulator
MDTFQALAEPRRREIIELLASRGRLTATDISDTFKISPPAISQHLKVLREAKLVEMEKKAQTRIYTINTNGLQELEEWTRKMRDSWEKKFNRLDTILKDLKQK